MIIAVGGAIVVIAVALILILNNTGNGNQENQNQQTAGAGESGKQQLANAGDSGKQDSGKQESGKQAANASGKTDGTSKEATAKKTDGDGKAAKEATAKKTGTEPAKKKSGKKKKAKISAFDPMTLEELAFPADTTDEQKALIAKLLKKTVEDEGLPGKRAGDKLMALGRHAYPAIVNRLRKFDYRDFDQATEAYNLHKILEEMTLGRNPGYKVPRDENIPQNDAYWNAKCVKPWHRQWDDPRMFDGGTKKAWDAFIEKRQSNQKD